MVAPEFLALAVTAFGLGVGSIVALRYKVPPLIIFLVMGMIIGASGYLQQNVEISYIGALGSVLLLFAIGTEFSIYELFSNLGVLREIRVAILEILVSFLILYFFFQIWFVSSTAMLLALAFSITSTGISMKLLEQLDLAKKFDIALIVKISVIEDIITVFIFTVISSFSIMAGHPLSAVVVSFLISLGLFIAAYLAFYIFLDKFLFRYQVKEEDLLMLALGVLLLLVSLATILGLSTSFGAYISGSIVSVWKKKWRGIENDLRKFSYIFISFFFLTVGLQASFLGVNLLLLVIIIPVVLIIKFGSVFLSCYTTYRTSRTSFFTSIGMLSRGELSLAIVSAAVGSSLLPAGFLGLTTLVVLATVLATFFLMKRSNEVYMSLRLRFPRTIIKRLFRPRFGA